MTKNAPAGASRAAGQRSIRTARSTGSDGSFGTDTEAGSILGTPAYMPPEQANGDIANLDRRADVFGLGAILCEILTGKPPYVGRSSEEVRRKAANGDLADATARLDGCGADPELIALTKKCLSPEAIDRPKDAQGVADGLTAYLDGVQERLQTAERERAVALAREVEERKRRKVQLALAASVLAMMLGGGAFAWWQRAGGDERARRQLVTSSSAPTTRSRNAEAVAALLNQCEEALQAGDAAKAAVALEAARKRLAEGGAEKEADRLERLDADLALLRDLDAVDQFRWTPDENKLPDAAAVATRTREALRRFGADPDAVSVDEAAARVSASVVRERIVSALDRLFARMGSTDRHVPVPCSGGWMPTRTGTRSGMRSSPRTGRRVRGTGGTRGRPGAAAGFRRLPGRERGDPGGAAAAIVAGGGEPAVGGPGPADDAGRYLPDSTRRTGRTSGCAGFRPPWRPPRPTQRHTSTWALRWRTRASWTRPSPASRRPSNSTRSSPVAHSNLGIALMHKGQLDEAIACHKKAIELDPKFASAHSNLGIALEDKGQLDEAIACYKKAIELDPKFASGPRQPGQCAVGQGPVGRGHRLLQEGHRTRPEVRHGPLQPGQCAEGQGPVGRGHRLLQEGHRTRPEARHGPLQPGHCAAWTRASWTRPSPATRRPSNSTRSTPWPTTTWAMR